MQKHTANENATAAEPHSAQQTAGVGHTAVNDAIAIELKDGDKHFQVVGMIYRVPLERDGYALIRYRGRRFVLRGGIRTEYFINIANPFTPERYNGGVGE
jgi:hypothetical protein